METMFEVIIMGLFFLIAATLVSFILVKLFQAIFGSRVACVLAGILILIVLFFYAVGMESYENSKDQLSIMMMAAVIPACAIVFALTLLVTMSEGLWAAMVAVFKYSAIPCFVGALIIEVFQWYWIGWLMLIASAVGVVWAWIRND